MLLREIINKYNLRQRRPLKAIFLSAIAILLMGLKFYLQYLLQQARWLYKYNLFEDSF